MSPKFDWTADDLIAEGRITRNLIQELKAWLLGTNLPELTEDQISLFLLSCNNDTDATKNTIRAYYKVRHTASHLFSDRNIERDDLQHTQQIACYGMIPQRTKEGYAVLIHRLRDFTYYKYHMEESMKVLFMDLDMVLVDKPLAKGLVYLMDMKGVGLLHLTRTRINAVRAFFQYLQEGLPIQLKQIHVFNVVYFFDKVMAIMKPFIKKEILDMLHLHPPGMDMEDFFDKYLSKDCIPSDYGGTSASVEEIHAASIKKMITRKQFFDDEERQRESYSPK